MPWFLSKFGRNDEPSWGFEDADIREGYMHRTYRPDPSRYPLKVCLTRPRKTLPDFTVGPWASLDVVSERFKRLVEDLDPITHDFIPLDVVQPDGTSVDTRHFIFRIGGLLPLSIDLAQSDVAESILRPGLSVYGPTSQAPRIVWHRGVVRQRHIWADQKLPSHIAVSDTFYTELVRQKMTSFMAVEGRFDDQAADKTG